MTIHGHGSTDQKLEDFYNDIPLGEAGKQLLDQLNRNISSIVSSLDSGARQFKTIENRLETDVSALTACLQDTISKCLVPHAPHEDQLMQLDGAKRRLKELTRLLEAREVFNSADVRLGLTERSVDDSLLPTLIAIGENLKIFKPLGAKPKFDSEAYHTTRDRYLTWKGTEFAVKFGSADGLDDIFEAFSALNSLQDFYRLYQLHFDQSLNSLVNVNKNADERSVKDLGYSFISRSSEHFRLHMSSLCKYCDQDKAFSYLLESWNNFVKNGGLETVLDVVIDAYSDYNLLDDLHNLVENARKLYVDEEPDVVSKEPTVEDVEKIMLEGFLKCSVEPLSKKLVSMIEPPPIDFKSSVEITKSIESFGLLLKQVTSHVSAIYSDSHETLVAVVKPIFSDYTTRLSRMQDKTKMESARVEEYLDRLNFAGQFHTILGNYQKDTKLQSGPEIKMAKKWISERVKNAFKASYRLITDRMPSHGEDVYKEEESKSAMPTPQDYVVTATQNLLHLLRLWEEALSNNNTRIAVVASGFESKEETPALIDEERIFALVLDKIASQVVRKFLHAINQFTTPNRVISRFLLKELLCDSEYLRDALIDLRAGVHKSLDEKIEELAKNLQNIKK